MGAALSVLVEHGLAHSVREPGRHAEPGQQDQLGQQRPVHVSREHIIAAPFDGTVRELRFRQGDAVQAAAILLDLQALEANQEP